MLDGKTQGNRVSPRLTLGATSCALSSYSCLLFWNKNVVVGTKMMHFRKQTFRWPGGRRLCLLRGRVGLVLESTKLTQITIDSSLMQSCSMRLDASCGDGLFQLGAPELY